MINEQEGKSRCRWSPRAIIAFIGFTAAAAFYLWTDHRVHVIGALSLLPYLIFLMCPLMHIFMHHGHGKHKRQENKGALEDELPHDGGKVGKETL